MVYRGMLKAIRMMQALGADGMTNGRVNPQFTLEDQGITGLGTVYYNLLETHAH